MMSVVKRTSAAPTFLDDRCSFLNARIPVQILELLKERSGSKSLCWCDTGRARWRCEGSYSARRGACQGKNGHRGSWVCVPGMLSKPYPWSRGRKQGVSRLLYARYLLNVSCILLSFTSQRPCTRSHVLLCLTLCCSERRRWLLAVCFCSHWRP